MKTNGSVAEVLAMYDASSFQEFDTHSSYNNIYAGNDIDTYCNNTFYSGLSSVMKSAIVDKTFTQDSWSWSTSIPTYSYYTGKYGSDIYYLTLANSTFGESITRHCYCISVQDVLDYLDATTSMGVSDTTMTDTNIFLMFLNKTTPQSSASPWLRSSFYENDLFAFCVNFFYGYLGTNRASNGGLVRPAFQIDLSKIEWTPVGG